MTLFVTDNLSTTIASNVHASERISSITLHGIAGQTGDYQLFRIGNESNSDIDLTLYTSDPSLSMSTNSARGFSTSMTMTVKAGQVGDTIFVRVTTDLDIVEGDRLSSIWIAPPDPYEALALQVNYFLAESDKGTTEESKFVRFAGKDTVQILDQIENEGESLTLIKYEPQPKPDPVTGLVNLQDFQNQRITEWANPNNQVVGYRATTYYVKGFIGDRNLAQNMSYGEPLSLSFSDAEQVIIPPDFDGFDPSPISGIEFFSNLTPSRDAYQRTQWILRRHDGDYSLINIREQKYFRGQFLFFLADLQRVNYQGGASGAGFLPWNQLYDINGKVIDYVPGYSTAIVSADPYDPFCLDDVYNPSIDP